MALAWLRRCLTMHARSGDVFFAARERGGAWRRTLTLTELLKMARLPQ
jgi:hypothetical protein